MTNLEVLVGKELSMEVCESAKLTIKVLEGEKVEYQFIGTEDETEDCPVTTTLEIALDDIEGIEDYSFTTAFGARYFLHQFDEALVF